MKLIVIFRAGLDAAKANEPRVIPSYIPYLDRDGFRFSAIKLDRTMRNEWIRGYDSHTGAV